mmetsp:Transcript_41993/g.65636  ORF Transcript_41993/g.65636 Transcript_41993/m.65636 type:complete len:192 (-) Transcript_41993:1859-2434(-)
MASAIVMEPWGGVQRSCSDSAAEMPGPRSLLDHLAGIKTSDQMSASRTDSSHATPEDMPGGPSPMLGPQRMHSAPEERRGTSRDLGDIRVPDRSYMRRLIEEQKQREQELMKRVLEAPSRACSRSPSLSPKLQPLPPRMQRREDIKREIVKKPLNTAVRTMVEAMAVAIVTAMAAMVLMGGHNRRGSQNRQ